VNAPAAVSTSASRGTPAWATVVVVSKQLGHANAKITLEVYAHLFDYGEHATLVRNAIDASYATITDTGT
jgi:integrase